MSKRKQPLSYRHLFHAGNHGDVLKHTVLSLLVRIRFRLLICTGISLLLNTQSVILPMVMNNLLKCYYSAFGICYVILLLVSYHSLSTCVPCEIQKWSHTTASSFYLYIPGNSFFSSFVRIYSSVSISYSPSHSSSTSLSSSLSSLGVFTFYFSWVPHFELRK